MKKVEVLNLNQILSSIKLNKLDKECRGIILNNHLKIYKVAKDITETVEEMMKKLTEGHESELRLLEQYRDEYKTADNERKSEIEERIDNECIVALEIEKEFAEFQNKLLSEEIEIEITKINREVFVDACAESGLDVTPADLMNLEYLFEE